MAGFAVLAPAIADADVAAGLRQQHVREVLGAHGQLELDDPVGADEPGRDAAGELGFDRMVHEWRISAFEHHRGAGAEGGGQALPDLGDPPLEEIGDPTVEGAHGAADDRLVGHDVEGVAGMDLGDREHGGIDGLLLAADDALQRHDQLAGDPDRITPGMGQGGMASLALDGDLELVGRSEHRSRAQPEGTDRHPWPVVHAVDRIAGESLEEPRVDHRLRACAMLLGRLKDEMHRAPGGRVGGQEAGRGEQHRDMPVVATGMHPAGMGRAMAEFVEFLQGQGIHVGAQAHGGGSFAAQAGDDAGAADSGGDLQPPGTELLGDQGGGAGLGVGEFRMGMDVPADPCDLGREPDDLLDQFHRAAPSGRRPAMVAWPSLSSA